MHHTPFGNGLLLTLEVPAKGGCLPSGLPTSPWEQFGCRILLPGSCPPAGRSVCRDEIKQVQEISNEAEEMRGGRIEFLQVRKQELGALCSCTIGILHFRILFQDRLCPQKFGGHLSIIVILKFKFI